MKLLSALSLFVAAAASAISYSIPYDGKRFANAPGPGLLSTAGLPLPNPFNGIVYDPIFSVINLGTGTLVKFITPNTPPNCLIATGTVGTKLGRWSKAANVKSIDFTSVAFACVTVVAGQPVQVGCTVLFESSLNGLGIKKNQVASAPVTANKQMTIADLSGIYGTTYLDLSVINVTTAGLVSDITGISLLIDTAKYSTKA